MIVKKQMVLTIRSLFLGVVLSTALTSTVTAGWQVNWIENFDSTRVNMNNWTFQDEANYNAELQCYTEDDTSANKNYDVSGGTLKIIARRQLNNCVGLNGEIKSWTSGRLNSKDKQEFLYGRIESRIKFNTLKGGTWPAFWMLENRISEQPIAGDNDFVSWPNSGAGEIDVWEWFSNQPQYYITNFFNASRNAGSTSCGGKVNYNYPNGGADVLDWHTYAMEWDQNAIKFFMDDILVATQNVSNCAQYKEPMFVLLNVAMGGTLGGTIATGFSSATMEVDYVAHCSSTSENSEISCNPSTPTASTAASSVTAGTFSTDGGGGNMGAFLTLLLGGLLVMRSRVHRALASRQAI